MKCNVQLRNGAVTLKEYGEPAVEYSEYNDTLVITIGRVTIKIEEASDLNECLN